MVEAIRAPGVARRRLPAYCAPPRSRVAGRRADGGLRLGRADRRVRRRRQDQDRLPHPDDRGARRVRRGRPVRDRRDDAVLRPEPDHGRAAGATRWRSSTRDSQSNVEPRRRPGRRPDRQRRHPADAGGRRRGDGHPGQRPVRGERHALPLDRRRRGSRGSSAAPAARTRPFRWTYNFFWGLDDVEAVYADMWDQVRTNKMCAGLWPDDSDGRAWGDPTGGSRPRRPAAATTSSTPVRYPAGTQELLPADRRLPGGNPDSWSACRPPRTSPRSGGRPPSSGFQPEDRDDRQGAAVPVRRGGARPARGEPGHRGLVVAAAPVHLVADRADRAAARRRLHGGHRPAVDPAASASRTPCSRWPRGRSPRSRRSTTAPALADRICAR